MSSGCHLNRVHHRRRLIPSRTECVYVVKDTPVHTPTQTPVHVTGDGNGSPGPDAQVTQQNGGLPVCDGGSHLREDTDESSPKTSDLSVGRYRPSVLGSHIPQSPLSSLFRPGLLTVVDVYPATCLHTLRGNFPLQTDDRHGYRRQLLHLSPRPSEGPSSSPKGRPSPEAW